MRGEVIALPELRSVGPVGGAIFAAGTVTGAIAGTVTDDAARAAGGVGEAAGAPPSACEGVA